MQRKRKPEADPTASAEVVDLVIEGFRIGEPKATRKVHRRVRQILAYRGYGMSREEQKDVEQEVMTQVWQAANRPEADLGPGFWGFIEVVTARRSIDWLRTRRPHHELNSSMVDKTATPLQLALSHESERLVAATLKRLPMPCRRLILLHAGSRKSYREIAGILHQSEGALRVQMHRCVQRAREVMEELQKSGLQEGDETERNR